MQYSVPLPHFFIFYLLSFYILSLNINPQEINLFFLAQNGCNKSQRMLVPIGVTKNRQN